MSHALELAERARWQTSPNPMVGSCIVSEDRIVGEGYHRRAGEPHAEIEALGQAGARAKGATIYVTLEPCCHTGRTGPCSQAIIDAGISRVVAAMIDPNPIVCSGGLDQLRSAGIEVEVGVLEEQSRKLNETYITHREKGRPFVYLKSACSLDGKVATVGGESQWITGEDARNNGHLWRSRVDAILVGKNTVAADNPRLTARGENLGTESNPLRVVLDSKLSLSPDLNVFDTAAAPTLVATAEDAPRDNFKRLKDRGVELIELPRLNGMLDLGLLMKQLAERDIISLLIEGGPTVAENALASKVVDRVLFYIAPLLIGGRQSLPALAGPGFERLADAVHIRDWQVERLGADLLITGDVG
jgi:diaminohydroxyphosphoribosylaminopyrimidine deaminase / 5-amino-6-(5-phosphoribosylamino)uracil reductase